MTDKEFLEEGYRRFPEACRTIRTFIDQGKGILRSAIEGKANWTAFTRSRSRNAIWVGNGKPDGAKELCIDAIIRGEVGRQGSID
jgi:hypothetical protein